MKVKSTITPLQAPPLHLSPEQETIETYQVSVAHTLKSRKKLCSATRLHSPVLEIIKAKDPYKQNPLLYPILEQRCLGESIAPSSPESLPSVISSLARPSDSNTRIPTTIAGWSGPWRKKTFHECCFQGNKFPNFQFSNSHLWVSLKVEKRCPNNRVPQCRRYIYDYNNYCRAVFIRPNCVRCYGSSVCQQTSKLNFIFRWANRAGDHWTKIGFKTASFPQRNLSKGLSQTPSFLASASPEQISPFLLFLAMLTLSPWRLLSSTGPLCSPLLGISWRHSPCLLQPPQRKIKIFKLKKPKTHLNVSYFISHKPIIRVNQIFE